MGQQATVAYFKIPFNYIFGGIEETTKILWMTDLLAKIRIRDFLHTIVNANH
jgi:hypothetical protein